MIPKRYVARLVGVAVALAFVIGFSVAARIDTGSWLTVAVIWGFVGICVGISFLLIWALQNWDAE